jgi:hypothetical protein
VPRTNGSDLAGGIEARPVAERWIGGTRIVVKEILLRPQEPVQNRSIRRDDLGGSRDHRGRRDDDLVVGRRPGLRKAEAREGKK